MFQPLNLSGDFASQLAKASPDVFALANVVTRRLLDGNKYEGQHDRHILLTKEECVAYGVVIGIIVAQASSAGELINALGVDNLVEKARRVLSGLPEQVVLDQQSTRSFSSIS